VISPNQAYGAHWRKVRLLILERDGRLCQIRGPRCTLDANEVDHVVPWRVGGALYDPEESARRVQQLQQTASSPGRRRCTCAEAPVAGVVTGRAPDVKRPRRRAIGRERGACEAGVAPKGSGTATCT
jgi:hypothetical protein